MAGFLTLVVQNSLLYRGVSVLGADGVVETVNFKELVEDDTLPWLAKSVIGEI